MQQTDAATVALARDGDSEAFHALVDRHSRAVYRLARNEHISDEISRKLVREIDLVEARHKG